MRYRYLLPVLVLAACANQSLPSTALTTPIPGPEEPADRFARCINESLALNPATPIQEAMVLTGRASCPPGMHSLSTNDWNQFLVRAEDARGMRRGGGRSIVETIALGGAPAARVPSASEIITSRREADLVQMAAARQPGLSSAIRSAAELNVDGRSRSGTSRAAKEAREAAIQAEEVRLIQVVEERAATQRSNAQAQASYAADRQAEAVCAYRGQQTEAVRPYRGLLNIDGMFAGAQAQNACLQMYRQTGIPPTP